MVKKIRRRVRKLPDNQFALFESADTAPSEVQKKLMADPRFRYPNRNELRFGAHPLSKYLEESRSGRQALQMVELLEQLDWGGFTDKYEGGGRQPYHPQLMAGLVLYGISR